MKRNALCSKLTSLRASQSTFKLGSQRQRKKKNSRLIRLPDREPIHHVSAKIFKGQPRHCALCELVPTRHKKIPPGHHCGQPEAETNDLTMPRSVVQTGLY